MDEPVDKKPWEIEPALQRDRLISLGRRLLEIREGVVKAKLPLPGETAWVLGVRAYEWTRFQLATDSIDGQSDWLIAKPFGNHRFDLRIGGVPIHYFRGTAEEPSEHNIQSGLDKAQGELFDKGDLERAAEEGAVWMRYVAVNTDSEGNGIGVQFFEAAKIGDDFKVRNVWPIPVNEPISKVTPITKAGTKLPSPKITPRRDPKKKSGSDDDKERP